MIGDLVTLLVVIVAGVVALIAVLMLVGKFAVWLFRFIGRFFATLGLMLADLVRFVGSLLLVPVLCLLVVANVVIGRWSASAHFGRAVSSEVSTAGLCLYRVFIGHPARLLGLRGAVEGFEQRLPKVIAEAPGRDKPSPKRAGQFDGYKIVGSLPGGGSGGKLYIAEPDELKQAKLAKRGVGDVDRVVIKTFSMAEGSSLPQIVRESRALDAAKKLGLVLEHELTSERFFYVMRYVPGESLSAITTRLHAESPADGLDNGRLRRVLTYAGDLVAALDTYHRGGLWHKDVKPDNIIIAHERAHLVDFGLVTPLRSAMTLTTHGTEYFRDPELVRQALRGVKVHQVDGTKFDLYAAGAVLYSAVENSFPAHGGLSQITKRCPDALRWIVRRAMAEYDNRYASATMMLADLDYLRSADDVFAVKPAELPSMRGGAVDESEQDVEEVEPIGPMPRMQPEPEPTSTRAKRRERPDLEVVGWWTGRYKQRKAKEHASEAHAGEARERRRGCSVLRPAKAKLTPPWVERRHEPKAGPRHRTVRPPASEQIRSARERAQAARKRAKAKAAEMRRGRAQRALIDRRGGWGIALAVFLFLAVVVGAVGGGVLGLFRAGSSSEATQMVMVDPANDGSFMAHVEGPDGGRVVADASGITVTGADGGSVRIGRSRGASELGYGRQIVASVGEGFREVLGSADIEAAAALAQMRASLAGTRQDEAMLVVSDLAPPVNDRAQSFIGAWVRALEASGIDTVGFLTDDAGTDLTAAVRLVRGAAPLDAGDLGPKLARFADQHDVIDSVLWVAPDPDRHGAVRFTLFAGGRATGYTPASTPIADN